MQFSWTGNDFIWPGEKYHIMNPDEKPRKSKGATEGSLQPSLGWTKIDFFWLRSKVILCNQNTGPKEARSSIEGSLQPAEKSGEEMVCPAVGDKRCHQKESMHLGAEMFRSECLVEVWTSILHDKNVVIQGGAWVWSASTLRGSHSSPLRIIPVCFWLRRAKPSPNSTVFEGD